ncbi:hypothetical protein GCM10011514_52360 [Emticicia aquatilis]|uniref:Uncharacterized protein n=1 Tax=Emticicia aquatilis TaxID=1537369 RepID=A0A916Z9Z7_9BACT|nr:DUF6169 family protein [Emticicia aquatilis]GGD81822.1 hypothetical protein GCM10011514_52360 [Emticicia aquatilis]
MELNLTNLDHHEFEKKNNIYQFVNDFGVIYQVYFTIGADYFPDTYFKNYLKTFGFLPISSTDFSFDKKTSETIIYILADFLSQGDYIVMFVCDEKDNKQSVRNRLFNTWFKKYNDGSFDKFDLVFEKTTFVSAIISKNNPFYIDFKNSFPNLGNEYK